MTMAVKRGYRLHFRNIAACHRAVAAGDYPNAVTLAADFGVNVRTVYRYLDFLREIGAPLTWVALENGFRYRRPWDFGKALLRWLDA